ncbi:MAG: hypothetical protein Q8Q08_00365 [Candidatus Omnitrophota bacterium]|nr:hypothetical protein [Candidatus Omnitrophota bacterium]MDZ4241955.1 hypothetical protein [Candidatus Omnitrophota bacterium]
MNILRRGRRGQSTLEFVTLLIIIMGVFIAAGNYFKRGIQGRWKASIDELGDQYDPRLTNTSIKHILVSNTETRITTISAEGGLWSLRDDITNSLEIKTGGTTIGAF